MKSDYEVTHKPHLPGATALSGVCYKPQNSVAFYKSNTRKRKGREGQEGEGRGNERKIK